LNDVENAFGVGPIDPLIAAGCADRRGEGQFAPTLWLTPCHDDAYP
jgi:hypothetical protein